MPTETQTEVADWLTVREAAQHLRVGARSLFRAIQRGELRASRVNERGDLRVSRAWLMQFVESRAERPAA